MSTLLLSTYGMLMSHTTSQNIARAFCLQTFWDNCWDSKHTTFTTIRPRFYCARTQEFRAWNYYSHTQIQLCQISIYMVIKQNSRKKHGIQIFWCTVFKILRLKKEKESKKLDVLPQEHAVSFSQKIYLCNLFLFRMNSFKRIFSKFHQNNVDN